ncbi:MAG TPA: TadE family protein [Candidatus Limnocylindria bacterium]|nr:TadE family protein [Candidatus Limnocylindria bacterium]
MLKRAHHSRGQALVELALVLPLFTMVLFGIVILGLGLFYQQQLTNGAREGARFAAIHSATSQCPVVSNLDPDSALLPLPNSYYRCDEPANGWPQMTAAARGKLFGMPAGQVRVTACWSGYWTQDTSMAWADYDQLARDPATGALNPFRECTVRAHGWIRGPTPSCANQDVNADASSALVINPRTMTTLVGGTTCNVSVDCSQAFPPTQVSDDMASNYAASNAANANQVTVLACYEWRPPLAGFLALPNAINFSAVVTEAMEYQQ